MLYYNEIRSDMERISEARGEGEPELRIPDHKFNRSIGDYANKNYTIEGDEWDTDTMGSYDEYLKSVLPSDEEWNQYLHSVLPNDDDEAQLQEYFKEEWIQYREWKD